MILVDLSVRYSNVWHKASQPVHDIAVALSKLIGSCQNYHVQVHRSHAAAMPTAFCQRTAAFTIACFCFLRRLPSSGPQRWQYLHAAAFVQRSLWKKSQGLHKPSQCPAEPTDGQAGVPLVVGSTASSKRKGTDACLHWAADCCKMRPGT